MIKKILFIILSLNFLFFIFTEEIQYKIIEKKGIVDIKFKGGEWHQAEIDQLIPIYAEILTGFHSQLTIEITKGSYLTINQLSHVIVNEEEEKFECCTTNVKLLQGYLLANAKRISNEKNKIFIYIENGIIEFNEASGEVYLREDKGSFVKAYEGKVKISTKKKLPLLNLRQDEICCFLPDGTFLDSDYFVRRNINIKPNNLVEPNKITAYYDQLFYYFTTNPRSNDYDSQFKP